MKLMYKLLILLLIPATIFANSEGKITKTKTIKKEFAVNKDALLNIYNKFGNIEIVTWNENRIVFEIIITTNGNNEDKVQNKLDDISIEFSNSLSNVSAKTLIGKSSNWSWFGNTNDINMKINYTVKVPVTNNVDLSNDYGNILIDKLEGSANLNCDYGKLIIGSLFNKNNTINLDYATASTISFVNGAKINADYSKLTIDKSNVISLNADYSTTVFERVGSLSFNADYGAITVENAKQIIGNSDYLTVKIGKITDRLNLKTNYGAIKIEELINGFDNVEINVSYTGVKIGVNRDSSFNLNANFSYGDLKTDNFNFKFNIEEKKDTSKKYQGYYNSNNSKSAVTINSTYGNTTFYRN